MVVARWHFPTSSCILSTCQQSFHHHPAYCSEELSEDDSFPEQELASLVVSKVYYHLGSFGDSITFALSAGSRFEVNSTSEYVQTIICKGSRDGHVTPCVHSPCLCPLQQSALIGMLTCQPKGLRVRETWGWDPLTLGWSG